MSKNKNNKPKYIHPQKQAIEQAGLLIKKFIEDIRHDRAFSTRLFYPVLYQNVVEKPIIRDNKIHGTVLDSETEFYLLKAEEYPVNGSVINAMLLANGPLVPQQNRLKLIDYCKKENERTIISRTKAFLHLLRDETLYNFVFEALIATNRNNGATESDLQIMRDRFMKIVNAEKVQIPPLPEATVINKTAAKNRKYLQSLFEFATEKDIQNALGFIRYMCRKDNIVTDFMYRPMSNDEIQQYLGYDTSASLNDTMLVQLEKMLSVSNYEHIAGDQLGFFTQSIYDAYKFALTARGNPTSLGYLQVFGNSAVRDGAAERVIKTRLKISIAKIHEYTKNYIRTVTHEVFKHGFNFDQNQADKYGFVGNIMYQILQYVKEGTPEGRRTIYNLLRNCDNFIHYCSDCRQKQNLCCIVSNIFENDLDYLLSFKFNSQKNSNSNDSVEQRMIKLLNVVDSVVKNVDDFESNYSSRLSSLLSTIFNAELQKVGIDPSVRSQVVNVYIDTLLQGPLKYESLNSDANRIQSEIIANINREIDKIQSGGKASSEKSLFDQIKQVLKRYLTGYSYRDLLQTVKAKLITNQILSTDKSTSGSLSYEDFKKITNDIYNAYKSIYSVLVNVLVSKQIMETGLKTEINSYVTALDTLNKRAGGIMYDDLSQIREDALYHASHILFYIDALKKLYTKILDSLGSMQDATVFENQLNSWGFTNLMRSLKGISIGSDGGIIVPDSILEVTNDVMIKNFLQTYCKTYLSPILYELVSVAIEEGTIAQIKYNNAVIAKDILGLSKFLDPSTVGTITFDANVFNDLAYLSYTFMGDTFAGLRSSNVDEVVNFLDYLYGLKEFNVVLMGSNDVYIYLNYVGVPVLYRGAKTKLRIRDIEENYRWMMDARDGLYKYLKLPRKKH